MEIYISFSILIVIATIFSYLNLRFLKLPSSIGIMVIAMLFSLGLVIIGNFSSKPLDDFYQVVRNIDFTQMLMGGMLNFLLFAGAININIQDLKEEKWPIIVFSTLSVIISTIVVGAALYFLLDSLLPLAGIHLEVPLIYCLLFGALISPTDPIAVLSILKEAKVSKALASKIAGESLFNDGVAVVLFTVIFSIAQGMGDVHISAGEVTILLLKEVAGGLLVGAALGNLGYWAMKTANDYKLAVMITLSVVMGGYLFASSINISGPLTMVAAGLIIGYKRKKYHTAEEHSNDILGSFWELIDDIFNTILFLFIGFEILLIPNLRDYWETGLICILVVLFARYVSIKLPTIFIPFREKFSTGSIILLVWGGLRGGVSIALALSIPEGPYKEVIISATYFVVVFSIIVQGLSIGKMAKRMKI
ncbi:sodium:proton antiporter [Dysgonomonas sp. 25]|uniref:cation:proton antiporter n=1 Tax=Dysgonomonas sp. 25 TaxID=2302933 RepID=UPI0013D4A916|nr:sodium:proton antiporter [Dysgonomonas sp. 25]NDV69311.1 sodium:proton antiporter [Dysgonomonas sp. 25]